MTTLRAVQFPLPNTSSAEQRRRAEQARAEAVRVCTRSAVLVAWAATTVRNVVRTCELLAAARLASHRQKAFLRPSETIHSLPLTPVMILEIAREFRVMAEQAATPEVSGAFHSLAFRYTAMAAGFDTDAISSSAVH